MQLFSYKYLWGYNYLNSSKYFNNINKTREISEFNSKHAFYRALQALHALFHKYVGLGSNYWYEQIKQQN